MATNLKKFEKLSDRLPAPLIASRNLMEANAFKDKKRKAVSAEHNTFRFLEIPMALIWLVGVPLFADMHGIYPMYIAVTWISVLLGGWCLWWFIFVNEEYSLAQRMGSVGKFFWIMTGSLHFLKNAGRIYREEMERLGENMLVKDDRFPTVNRLFANIASWDQDVKLINRLIDQVDLGLISEADVQKLYDSLRADEEFLLANITYAERLMKEGPLGTSVGLSENPVKAIEQVDRRMLEIDDNRKALREFAQRLDAAAEVSRLK